MFSSINDIPWAQLLKQDHYHPSPRDWSDQVIYFLLIDRFSDGNEDGFKDASGQVLRGSTPLFSPADANNAVQTEADTLNWETAGTQWLGGTLKGIQSKIGYLKRLGITALWISPVLRQRPGVDDYHGYGTQNFLEVDPHFGTAQDFQQLVAAAHEAGLYVILDVVLNHSADVFQYATVDPDTGKFYDPVWNGTTFPVAGWRDATGVPSLPFPEPVIPPTMDSAVWPGELQADGVFTCKGQITHWDDIPETTEGDFYGLKDIHQGTGPVEEYQSSVALQCLTQAYQYWLAYADLDGFRVDTVKHMDPGATRYFTSAIHEFAQTIGKDSFFLVGEITGGRDLAIRLRDETGLDAALGLEDVQGRMVNAVKGWANPSGYFELFRNSFQVDKATHTWFRDHVVTAFDDHDLVRLGSNKARFAADQDGRTLELAVLALNATTLGIPCVYYGSEQRFDGKYPPEVNPAPDNDFKSDRYIREAMFGGGFGPFRSRGRHFFDESAPVYRELANILAIRKTELALRRGRQYLRPLSDDGSNFWYPERIGEGRMTSIVAWSRILSSREVVCAINTDSVFQRTAWVTIDAGLHSVGDTFQYAYSTDPSKQGLQVAAEGRNGLAIRIDVAPAGFVIMVP